MVNTVLNYFGAQIVPDLACVFLYYMPTILFIYLFFRPSLLLGIIGYLKLILYLSFLSSQVANFSKNPKVFVVEMVLETNFRGVSVLVTVEMSLLLGPFNRQSWEHTHTHIHIHILEIMNSF